jgi:hypothetical protein
LKYSKTPRWNSSHALWHVLPFNGNKCKKCAAGSATQVFDIFFTNLVKDGRISQVSQASLLLNQSGHVVMHEYRSEMLTASRERSMINK